MDTCVCVSIESFGRQPPSSAEHAIHDRNGQYILMAGGRAAEDVHLYAGVYLHMHELQPIEPALM